ncbi:MAG TPA: hypothetical protein VF334_15345 [Polyangia bacterium]
MRRLAEIDRGKLVGILADRLGFERAAVARYRVVVAELERAEPAVQRIVPRLGQQLGEKSEHVTWLQGELHRLEAPYETVRARSEQAQRDCERLFGDGAPSALEMLRGLGRLELADADAWEILVDVAARAGDEPARSGFARRRDEERGHARFLHRVLVELTVNDTLGHPVTLPIAP